MPCCFLQVPTQETPREVSWAKGQSYLAGICLEACACQSRVVRSGLWKYTAQVQIQLMHLLACDLGPVIFLYLGNPLVGVVACEALGAGLDTWKALNDCWLSLLFPGFMGGKRSILCVISQQTKVSWQKGNRYPCF